MVEDILIVDVVVDLVGDKTVEDGYPVEAAGARGFHCSEQADGATLPWSAVDVGDVCVTLSRLTAYDKPW